MLPTPAPVPPSTIRQTQCGAASTAIHAPPPASAPNEHGSAAPGPDRSRHWLLPPSTAAAVRGHQLLPADHAPAAAPPSPPAATLPAAHPSPPQTHCVIPHAGPRSHPDSASAPPYPVPPAAAVPPVCDR